MHTYSHIHTHARNRAIAQRERGGTDKKRHTDRQRHRERQTDRQTDRQTEKETER